MKRTLIFISCFLVISVGFIFWYINNKKNQITTPVTSLVEKITEKPLKKYTFAALKDHTFTPSSFSFGDIIKDENNYISREFYFTMDPYYSNGNKKSVSGLINIPKKEGIYPIIVMYRGFVPREIYTIGEGTRRTAEAFASGGFITLAPDFLGYGKSGDAVGDSIEDRFQTYTTAITLLKSLPNLNKALGESNESASISADTKRVGIWGHSNGGHISLSVLAITGKSYPTVLWNPVTKPFPYSILYFTDEFEDNGKALRKVVADFEKDYDIEEYSPTNYYKWITSPIQLHQAVADEAVPLRWSNQFYDQMEKLEKDVEYFTYPEENHNFNLGSWSLAMQRSIQFYLSEFRTN